MHCINAGICPQGWIKDIMQPTLLQKFLAMAASSRLFQSLVKEQQLFSNIECSHFGSIDAGLLYIEGKLVKGDSYGSRQKMQLKRNWIK